MAKRLPDCCGNCQFYRIQQCHRFPPSPVTSSTDDGGTLTRWPEMNEDEWCGEHKRVVMSQRPYGEDYR